MILTQPTPTPADLHFQLAGIPVRVHPFFWIVALLLSGGGEPRLVLCWMVAVFVSIIVHEFGHAVLQRYYGGRPRIVLYSFGGLAAAEGVEANPWQQILICLAGPAAGFLLATLMAAALLLTGVPLRVDFPFIVPGQMASELGRAFVFYMFQINILWGLVNLLPVYPLDGGQATRELFTLAMPPARGIVASLWLSIVTAAAAAAVFLLVTGSLYVAIMFAFLAYSSYQTLQAFQDSRRGYQ